MEWEELFKTFMRFFDMYLKATKFLNDLKKKEEKARRKKAREEARAARAAKKGGKKTVIAPPKEEVSILDQIRQRGKT